MSADTSSTSFLGKPESLEGDQSRSGSEVAKSTAHESTENSERSIVPLIAHTVAVFGDEHKASRWLATPLPMLDNRSPSQLLETEGGTDLVEQILTRIEHNIPS